MSIEVKRTIINSTDEAIGTYILLEAPETATTQLHEQAEIEKGQLGVDYIRTQEVPHMNGYTLKIRIFYTTNRERLSD